MQSAPIVAVAAGLGLTAAVFGAARLRRRSPQEKERLRRIRLRQNGRLAAGEILEWFATTPAGKGKTRRRAAAPAAEPHTRLIYRYEIAGVCYESSQDEALPDPAAAGLLPGAAVSIKYDPRNPGNAILLLDAKPPARVARDGNPTG